MIKSESLAKIAPALVEAQKKMGAALKDSKNPFFKSSYADLGAVIDASVPVLNEHGIAVLQTPTSNETGKSVIRTLLLHASGEYVGSDTDIVSSKPNDPQAYGSAISYARRYGLQSTVTLKAEDDDGEKAMTRTSKVGSTKEYSNNITAPSVEKTVSTISTGVAATTTDASKKKVTFSKKAVTSTTYTPSEDI